MAWDIVYFKNESGSSPPLDFLDDCPTAVEAKITRVLDAVAAAPPPSFSGGGYWEAMHGKMTGYFEVRVTGPKRELFRLYCLLDQPGNGLPKHAIAAITGLRKPWMTVFSEKDYRQVRRLGNEYLASSPRSIVEGDYKPRP